MTDATSPEPTGTEPGGTTGSATGSTESQVVTTRGTVVIDRESCKGCILCIDACPPNVLIMTTDELNERGYPYPVLVAGCTGCKACSQICPDFVFQVYKYDTPLKVQVAADADAVVDSHLDLAAHHHHDTAPGDLT